MKRRGFTLVELIITLNLTLSLVGGMLFSFGQVTRAWRRAARAAEQLQIQNVVAERINRDIRTAGEILPDSSPVELKLRRVTKTVSYTLNSGKVRRKSDSYSAYLTDVNEIEKLNFSYPSKNLVEVRLANFVFQATARNFK